MKAFTDIEQSKKLAEILPIESADMYYTILTENSKEPSVFIKRKVCRYSVEDGDIPCWSLSALLNIIPYPSLHKTFSGWRCDSYNKEGTSCKLGEPSVNPVDACYEMIIKLKEQKLL